ncbi:MAG: hypothetical protein ACFE0Q_06195 [Anaerolineae bacterium]
MATHHKHSNWIADSELVTDQFVPVSMYDAFDEDDEAQEKRREERRKRKKQKRREKMMPIEEGDPELLQETPKKQKRKKKKKSRPEPWLDDSIEIDLEGNLDEVFELDLERKNRRKNQDDWYDEWDS